MAVTSITFAFDENADIETNLGRFETHLSTLDDIAGAALAVHFAALRSENVDQPGVWNALAEALEPKEASIDDSAAPPANPSPASPLPHATSAAVPIASGWLLEGVSIEGFRGVNNQGNPLELRFFADRINSISAQNGVGKSSIYDAIRYAISGRLPWLEDLPAGERGADYYVNRFNKSGRAIIKLRLVEESSGQKCEITVTLDAVGSRTTSAPAPWNADDILRSLDREFVLLDGPTFQDFITAKPLDRGRTFAGLLGLSEYSRFRQALAGLSNTRAFNNHFETTLHAQKKAHELKSGQDASEAFHRDYVILTGEEWKSMASEVALDNCHKALSQIAIIASHCDGKEFAGIDIDACIEAVKAAEGGPKRERLSACIRERKELAQVNLEAPHIDRAEALVERAQIREDAAGKTAGQVMLQLFQAGAKALELPEWSASDLCPLCDTKVPHNLQAHVSAKLANFTTLDEATRSLAVEWSAAGWTDLVGLEAKLETTVANRLIAKLGPKAQRGMISVDEAKGLVEWLKQLRQRAGECDQLLQEEQTGLEKELPQSAVEVTKKIEAGRRLQESLSKWTSARDALEVEKTWEQKTKRLKTFLDRAHSDFSAAETAISKARLTAVEPVFQKNYADLAFFGVTPAVSKKTSGEDLHIHLAEFHGLTDLSPQAILSESFRNAFAISLYLAAASLYGGMPKFLILDDITSSLDAGHQYFLVELLRTKFARPGNPAGLQVILLSHDTMLEKLFNRHVSTGSWWHQRLEGAPQVAVLPQAGAVNKVKDHTLSMLLAGQVESAKEGVRQYLEYRLSDLISKLRIPVPIDLAFNENKQLAGDFLNAIEAAVKLHKAANTLVLEPAQEAGLNSNMATIVGNYLSHWGTGQALAFSAPALQGVMAAIDAFCDCFTFVPASGTAPKYYKSLSQRL
ncbi:AAA family ATPase [Neorhizobium sp. Rsf11]|uniref:AAA family ATPase n=1 Tax=Neorhizobium phenanthreniclasticum TaxID=3157917 RepID=A0ABV0LVH6_9HYPH